MQVRELGDGHGRRLNDAASLASGRRREFSGWLKPPPPLTSAAMSAVENILVVPRPVFDRLGAFEGLSFEADRYMAAFLDPQNNLFLPRPAAEDDPTHKQLIPYLVLRHGDRILCYTRGGGGGEARLHAKQSIGIGGHINDGDTHAAHFDRDAYFRAVERELHEELEITAPYRQRIVALLNDDSNAVGRVHLGVVHLVDLESADVRAKEDAIGDPVFLDVVELEARRENLETWSQICIGGLPRLLAAQPA
jgi:predicted NUDIX family phosphoesterase